MPDSAVYYNPSATGNAYVPSSALDLSGTMPVALFDGTLALDGAVTAPSSFFSTVAVDLSPAIVSTGTLRVDRLEVSDLAAIGSTLYAATSTPAAPTPAAIPEPLVILLVVSTTVASIAFVAAQRALARCEALARESLQRWAEVMLALDLNGGPR